MSQKIDVTTMMSWSELLRAVREFTLRIPPEQLAEYDAERLESAAKTVRLKLAEYEQKKDRLKT